MHLLLQQQQENQQQQQHQQLIFENPHHGQQQIVNQDLQQQFSSPQPIPQSPHLPTSPQFTSTHPVPQSPQVPQSPLIQRQGSVEPLQSPGPDYNNPGLPIQQNMQDTLGLGSRFSDHGVQDFGAMPASGDDALMHNIQQQIQMQQPQNVHVNNLTLNDNMAMQNVRMANLHNHSIPNSASIELNNQLQQQINYNQSVNLQPDQNVFQSQISGHFQVGDELVPSVTGPSIAGSNTTSEIVSLITSLESSLEVQPGAMQEIQKPDGSLLQLQGRGFSADNNPGHYQHQLMSPHENGMNNSFNEYAHNHVVQNQGVSSSYNSLFVSQPQVTESRGNVKQELLKHLASKPSSPRAAQGLQFPFQNSVNTSTSNTNAGGPLSHRQRHHSAKAELSPHSSVSKAQEPNSELKRRLSAGPEDIRSPLHSFTSAPDIASRTYVKPGPSRSDDITKPRLRSKSGDDYRLHRSWGNEDLFTKPKVKTDEFAHRPRSKTDEHLPKWKNKESFSKSDGAGVFRNPSSMAPLKMRRKHRPAPLIIPPHASMCGFQSRLRSPRIYMEGENGSKTAPVPYTPPPMLSPLRIGSGLFSSIGSASCTSQPLLSAGSVSTPRPSLLRSGKLFDIKF